MYIESINLTFLNFQIIPNPQWVSAYQTLPTLLTPHPPPTPTPDCCVDISEPSFTDFDLGKG